MKFLHAGMVTPALLPLDQQENRRCCSSGGSAVCILPRLTGGGWWEGLYCFLFLLFPAGEHSRFCVHSTDGNGHQEGLRRGISCFIGRQGL